MAEMDWELAQSTLTKLIRELSSSADEGRRQQADAVEMCLRLARQVERVRRVNADLRERRTRLEGWRPGRQRRR
jgi:hypothetical protein